MLLLFIFFLRNCFERMCTVCCYYQRTRIRSILFLINNKLYIYYYYYYYYYYCSLLHVMFDTIFNNKLLFIIQFSIIPSLYTVSQKSGDAVLLVVLTLSHLNRFSNFFRCSKGQEICSKTLSYFPPFPVLGHCIVYNANSALLLLIQAVFRPLYTHNFCRIQSEAPTFGELGTMEFRVRSQQPVEQIIWGGWLKPKLWAGGHNGNLGTFLTLTEESRAETLVRQS